MQITSRTLTPAENMMRLFFPQAYAARVAQELYGLEGMLGEPPQIVSEEGPPAPGQKMTQLGVYESGTGMFSGVNDPERLRQLQNLKLLASQAARIAPVAPQVAENVLGGLATALQNTFQPRQTIKPTSLIQNLIAAGYVPGTPEFQKKMMDILQKPQTQINMETKKPLGANAAKWRNEKGEQPNPMMTIEEATAAGFTPRSADELKSIMTGRQAAPLVGGLAAAAFGEGEDESLFPPITESPLERGVSGIQSWLAGKAQSDERLTLYSSLKDAFVSQMARLAGQVGTLTERDVDTVRGLFPVPGFTPEPIAKSQFRQIAAFLKSKGVPDDQLVSAGLPEWSISKPEGIPPGSVYVGVDPKSGKGVWQAPDGKRWLED